MKPAPNHLDVRVSSLSNNQNDNSSSKISVSGLDVGADMPAYVYG